MLGADLGLALTYVPLRNRGALAALFAIDRAMGDVVRTTKEPMLGPIRLAWWRERLEELDEENGAPAEPRLQAVERELLPRGISGHDIAAIEGGWLRLFDPFPWSVETSEAIWLRGNLLFGLGARILAAPGGQIQTAGGLWALVDVARHLSDRESREMLLNQARAFARELAGISFASKLRPLSMLTALAMRDCRRAEPFEAEGTPRRVAAMLRHRFSGRLPRPART
ncbi:MAG TPA: squalene/phytoene synthase family protein [Sphingomicrobium sp.]|jgi:phytoene synthase|nr:squalene/phytoene synthase family protein [Sphingomicrobium sp.]